MAKSTPSQTPKDKGNGFQTLPFEPKGKQKEPTAKTSPKPPSSPKVAKKAQGKSGSAQGIPEVVSKRMAKRMALFCGLPSLLGLVTFPVSYFLLQKGIELPNVVVLLVSLGLFGLGVLGLSYGVLSASWEEESAGTAIGWKEFTLNLGRVLESWKMARNQQKS
jgi:Photosynthesis affected mutant 68